MSFHEAWGRGRLCSAAALYCATVFSTWVQMFKNQSMRIQKTGSYRIRHFRSACLLFCLLIGFVASGCASGRLNNARKTFYNGSPDQAAGVLSKEDDITGRNELLYLMEKGAILHHAGDFQKSTEALLKATALMKDQDIISAGQQTASLVTTEWLTDYKGEYAERLLVHTYLMMNFLLMEKHESALVEAKQALKVFDEYPDACNSDFFTRALIAHCFEALGEINGAYIEYKKLAELMGDSTPVARRLYNLSARLGFDDEVGRFSQYLPPSAPGQGKPGIGEVIIFFSQGRSPVKIPHDIVLPPSIRFSFSTYEDRAPRLPPPSVGPLAGARPGEMITTDVGAVLRASLKERLAQIIIKETARVAAKEAIAHNIDNDGAELLVRLIFFLMEVPDTRGWQTLPAYFSMVRIPVSDPNRPIRIPGTGQTVTLPERDESRSSGPFYYYFSVRNP